MLIWMCALHCEAKPVIDHYRLKKTEPGQAYDSYSNNEVLCVVSGLGEINMGGACAWVNHALKEKTNHVIINLGIAGHQNLDIGTAVYIHEVSHQQQSGVVHLSSPVEHNFPNLALISQSQENTEYHPHAAFDMEAFVFAQNCCHFSIDTSCHCIKVISDNANSPPTRNKALISQLIADNMSGISRFADQLIAVNK